MNQWLAFFISVGYVFVVIGVAELLGARLGYGSDFTRKLIHIGVGMISWTLPFLFFTPWPFVAAALIFALLNLLDWRFGFLAAMASSDRANLGTVYFPLAAAFVVILFWEQPPLMVAALMPLTWGDGLAAPVGRSLGTISYTVWRHTRTLQGSAAFFAAGLLFTWLALWLIPGPPSISPAAALAPAVAVMAVTTVVEAISVWGLDNLSVTLTAVAALLAWPF
ncbi:MAG: hypothetical protein R3272_03970 [Candidatus Promineifilaceae bacterium]|nr:hypothetical protein [Candidatus Promineifilaceae bacterium]